MKKAVLAILVCVLLMLLVSPSVWASGNCRKIHIVRRGENLSRIARRYGTTVNCLMRANPRIRNPNVIYRGQRLCIPDSCGGKPKPKGTWYRIRRGNTMYSIARHFNANMWCIAKANSIRNPNRIYAGRLLWIPSYCRR
jgi:LysM repeat protein